MKSIKYITLLFIVFNTTSLLAQKATEANRPQDTPVDFSKPENIVLFIVLPIIVIILYFIWRKHKRKDALEAKNNSEENRQL